MLLKKICKSLFREAGITINGTKDSDLIVKDDRFYTNVVFRGSIGLGEAYMKSGDKYNSIINYEKSLKLDSSNNNAMEMIKILKST